MQILILIFIFFETFTKANPSQESKFLQFNNNLLDQHPFKTCQNPNFYVEMANIEESKPENQDKIILYHGESYGVWLFQLILKAFMYPEADEDWLPLRYIPLEKEIDKTDLLKLIFDQHADNFPAYKEIGLSVSPNLVSLHSTESAWYFICELFYFKWQKINGLSGDHLLHSLMYEMIRDRYIPEIYWENFKRQKKIIYKFIQVKREKYEHYKSESLYSEIKYFYPKTFKEFKKQLKTLRSTLEKYKNRNLDRNDGVALQIIMDKKLANELTYSSHPFGYIKNNKDEKYEDRKPWTGEDIKPYSEIYLEEKNQLDMTQARLAMNNDFRSFPSRVKIKSIAGIMEDPTDYEILKSMIRELVEVNKRKEKK